MDFIYFMQVLQKLFITGKRAASAERFDRMMDVENQSKQLLQNRHRFILWGVFTWTAFLKLQTALTV